MTTYVALLRGINVGGRNKVPMGELREVLSAAGHRDVRTYVQSGNVVLTSRSAERTVAASVREQLADAFGMNIGVIVRSADELADVAAHNPFLGRGDDPGRQLHVAFLETTADPKGVAGLDPHRAPPDELHVRGAEVYLWCPNGIGRSKVFNGVERALGTSATLRNWRTVTELARMTGATD